MPVEISDTISKSEYEGLDNKRKSLFTADKDNPGQYLFEDVSALRQSYHNTKTKLDTINSEFDSFKSKFKDIDPDKYKELSERKDLLDKQLTGDQISVEEHERRVKAMKDDYEGKIGKLSEANTQLNGNYDDLLFENTVIKKLKELEVDDMGMHFLPGEIRKRVKFEEEDNGVKNLIPLSDTEKDDKGNFARLYDNRGEPADIGFLVEEVVDKFGEKFVPARSRGGAGSKTDRRTTSGGGKSWDEMSDVEKSNLGDRGGRDAINAGVSGKIAAYHEAKQQRK